MFIASRSMFLLWKPDQGAHDPSDTCPTTSLSWTALQWCSIQILIPHRPSLTAQTPGWWVCVLGDGGRPLVLSGFQARPLFSAALKNICSKGRNILCPCRAYYACCVGWALSVEVGRYGGQEGHSSNPTIVQPWASSSISLVEFPHFQSLGSDDSINRNSCKD